MDIIPIILANAFLFVIVVSCLRRKRFRMQVIKQVVTAKSRKLTAKWTIEYSPDEPHEPL